MAAASVLLDEREERTSRIQRRKRKPTQQSASRTIVTNIQTIWAVN
ncbi:hypothetical protein CCACVL1_20376 [Corchorus capsularis]|uniref:Uncharacterized protein n=1 Tax=Corchorus capsularis TaxID=210143 RepID=A0A1R3HBJ1_COCAP|nr:hypothetical protein CCACVL1_20376 [Corchorus capsularis]